MRTRRGFTLIELLVTIAIVALLVSIAMPSYRRYVMASNRAEAWAALLQVQSGEEKFYMQNSAYTTDLTDPPGQGGLGIALTGSGGALYTANNNYAISIATAACNPAAAAVCGYTATATAANNQVNDNAACLTFTIDSLGQRTPADSTGCWR